MNRFLAICATLAAALAISACGGDDDPPETDAITADVERYCEIVAELDQAGEEQFEALESNAEATRQDFEEAERNLIEDNQDLFDELRDVAPTEISVDVTLLIESIEARGGLSDAEFTNSEINKAENALTDFESENCEDPSAEGDAEPDAESGE